MPIIIISPPIMVLTWGISLKINKPKTEANTGSNNFAVETKEAFRYFKAQLKILCPIRVQITARHRPRDRFFIPHEKSERW